MDALFGAMLASAGVGGSDLSLCTEGHWRGLPDSGSIFRAVRGLDVDEVEQLLEQERYKRHINDLDGDGGSALHILGLAMEATFVQAEGVVKAFKNAGANLDVRGGQMMSAETPLMAAACYGNYAVIKALIDAGAAVDISDDRGRTPLSRAEDQLSKPKPGCGTEDIQKSLDIIREAVQKEKQNNGDKSSSTISAQARRGDELRKIGNQLYAQEEWKKAADMYTRSIRCHEEYRALGNRAAAYLSDAIDRAMNGQPGYRQLFKQTYMDAAKSVELQPTYEKGWYRMARGYLGFRELPRAKQAASDGLDHFPDSRHLNEIWSVLEHCHVPDEVLDHDSDEWKAIYERLYVDHWIGDVQCQYCQMKCMDDPPPEHCPFCGCSTSVELADDDDDMIVHLTLFETSSDE